MFSSFQINDEHFLDIIKTEQNTSLIMFCLRQWKSEHENVEMQVQVLHIPMDERHVISAKYADIEKVLQNLACTSILSSCIAIECVIAMHRY